MYKKIFYCLLVVIFTAAISSCGKDGKDGKDGVDGKDGKDGKAGTVVTIVDDYWCIDGVKTPYKVIGEGGAVKVPYIGTDGYWYIDGEKTNFKAVGEPGKPGSVISIGTDGYWYIDDVKTDYKATGDGGSSNKFTLTFDADNGTPLITQAVYNDAWARPPLKDPVKSSASIPINNADGGLYLTDGNNVFANYSFAGWYDGNELFEFDAPVTKNITLKAKWISYSFDVYGEAWNIDFDKAIGYVNANPGTYALLLDDDIKVSGSTTRTLSSASKLTIIGLGAERKISLTTQGRILTVGTNPSTNQAELTLGNNITLVGLTDGQGGATQNNNGPVLSVYSHLIMLDGSKITGNTTVSGLAVSAYATSAAVSIVSAGGFNPSFTMKGGDITGNKTLSQFSNLAAGLVAGTDTDTNLEGGRITGNDGPAGDVFSFRSSLTFSGTAQVGTLTLNANNSAYTSVKIASGWTGDNVLLNLFGQSNYIEDVISFWEGNTILQDEVNATTIAKFQLESFMNNAALPITARIDQTHYINSAGVLTAK